MKEIVEHPDYLIETNKSNTALVLKEIIAVNNKVFKVVVRLNTSTDNPQYKNSIITFMKINEKEWKRLLKIRQFFTKENKNSYDKNTINKKLLEVEEFVPVHTPRA